MAKKKSTKKAAPEQATVPVAAATPPVDPQSAPASAKAAASSGKPKKPVKKPSPPETAPQPLAPAASAALPAKSASKPRAAAKPAPSDPPATASAPPPNAPPPAAPMPAPAPTPLAASPAPIASVKDITPETVIAKAEMLTQAIAQATMRSQSVLNLIADANQRTQSSSPDPFGFGAALGTVMGKVAAEPDSAIAAQVKLWNGYTEIWRDAMAASLQPPAEPVQAAPDKDRRFQDPDWQNIPYFDLMRRSYKHTVDWMSHLIDQAGDLDEQTRRKASFFMRQIAEAYAPSNFPLTNPVILRETIAQGGENLVRGMENFAQDIERGAGKLAITQTDPDAFQVGGNIANTPGKVVFRNELLELIHYAPQSAQQYDVPLLFIPPCINKFYILDLGEKNSMIRWLCQQGFSVLLVSWVNPSPDLSEKTFEDYVFDGLLTALEKTRQATGSADVNIVGYCIGGTMLASALAYLAQTGERGPKSATFFAAQMDFSAAGELLSFTDEAGLKFLEEKFDEGEGVLSSLYMADTFNALRPSDLIWNYFINNYMLGKSPKAFDLLYWNSDQTRMPRAMHLYYIRNFYKENALTRGEMTLRNIKLDLSKVQTPIFIQASREDHIAPFESVYRSARLFGGPVRLMLAGSGHIAGVINPPAAQKYQHWLNEALPPTKEEWIAAATERPGSWWPAWAQWLAARSGDQRAPRDPEKGGLPIVADAPGAYVREKSLA